MAIAATILSLFLNAQSALADSTAPFGLTWGMTLQALESRGVGVRPLFSDGPDTRVAVRNLPKMLSDTDEAILSFGADNRLRRIEARSIDFRHDSDGARLKARYNALSRALTAKYGKGETHHDIAITWRKPTDFLMGLYRGASTYYSTFAGTEVAVRLEIRATRRFVGHYVLIFEYKAIRDEGDGLSKERDIL